MENIAIIGLGLMGGSLAKAIKRKTTASISAIDSDELVIDQALREGMIDDGDIDISKINLATFDFIILCTPIEQTLRMMETLNGKLNENCIVSDIGSTKEEVMEQAKLVNYTFIGGHPMVGSEKFGYENAKAHLFENAYYVVTPSEKIEVREIKKIMSFIQTIGAIPIKLTAETHDLLTAVISHVPHIVASSLVQIAYEFEDEGNTLKKLAAGGFKDITRIASSNPDLWKQISLSNREKIIIVLKRIIHNLERYQEELKNNNGAYLFEYLDTAKKVRDQYTETVNTDIPNQFYLMVDIEDKPGMIAKISTLLFEKGINIKNIGITHNREFENGVLKIILENKVDHSSAVKVLKQRDYNVYA